MVMVNSTWTRNNIDTVWNVPERTSVVFPPCNTSDLSAEIPLERPREPTIISVAQFRDEKNHYLQLLALQHLFQAHPEKKALGVKLVLIGSCRNDEDQRRIDDLRRSARELGIFENVEFQINVSYPDLKKWFSRALIGLHTMWCEHFGIGIVELMAAGVVVIAHNSGGPKSDIVKEGSGYLASTKEEYANYISAVLEAKETELMEIRRRARESTGRFSEEAFSVHFYRAFSPLLTGF